MTFKLMRAFIVSAGGLLLITGTAKLVAAGGQARVLEIADPILFVSFRNVFIIIGFLELVIASVCFFGKNKMLQLGLIAWFASNCVLYRLGLWLSGWHKPCDCLGNLTDAVGISPLVADVAMKIILAYLFIGSCGTLLHLWCHKRKGFLSKNLELR